MKQTEKLAMNLPEYTDVVDIEQLNDNFRKLDTEVTNKLSPDGDGSNVVVSFTAASTRVNVSSGEKISVLLGKIAKWLNDLGDIAFLQGDVALTDKIDKSYLSTDVQASLDKADTALQSAPVTSVNGQTGEVVLDLDSLPKVTADDNGKFLRVVEGAWGTAEIPNTNGVSF